MLVEDGKLTLRLGVNCIKCLKWGWNGKKGRRNKNFEKAKSMLGKGVGALNKRVVTPLSTIDRQGFSPVRKVMNGKFCQDGFFSLVGRNLANKDFVQLNLFQC